MNLINLFGPAGRDMRTYIVFSSTFSGGGGAETVLLLVQIGLALYFSLTMTIFIYLFRFLTSNFKELY